MAPRSMPTRRSLRIILLGLLSGQVAIVAVAVWVVRSGMAPALSAETRRVLAYAWVGVTIAAAVAAYVVARSTAARPEPSRTAAALAAAVIADTAAVAGIALFLAVQAWPMLVVALMVGVLGVSLAWPAGLEEPGSASPVAEAGEDRGTLR